MNAYKVKLQTVNGQQEYILQGDSLDQVQSQLAVKYAAKDVSFMVEQLPKQQALTPDQMPQLMNATMGLMACIVALAVADHKVKVWLKS